VEFDVQRHKQVFLPDAIAKKANGKQHIFGSISILLLCLTCFYATLQDITTILDIKADKKSFLNFW
jgi:hypothetical protein